MTNTDTQFGARFSDLTPTTFMANTVDLADYVPAASPLNTGLMADIGRATIYNPDYQPSFYSRFMRDPLSRGDSNLKAAVGEIASKAYNPLAPDTELFNASRPTFFTDVAKKNFSRQAAVEVNDYMMSQFAQTDEMIGYAESAIMACSNVCYLDDMWVAAKEFFTGNLTGSKPTQSVVMGTSPTDPGYGAEIIEQLWNFSQKGFGFKSDRYNAKGRNTRSESVSIVLRKDAEYPAFKKLLSETFNPELLRVAVSGGIDYVDDFATTPAGKPAGAGDLLGIVVDNRTWDIVPMPNTLRTESFRNPSRLSTAYFTTYEYAFQNSPFFNIGYIFDKE